MFFFIYLCSDSVLNKDPDISIEKLCVYTAYGFRKLNTFRIDINRYIQKVSVNQTKPSVSYLFFIHRIRSRLLCTYTQQHGG